MHRRETIPALAALLCALLLQLGPGAAPAAAAGSSPADLTFLDEECREEFSILAKVKGLTGSSSTLRIVLNQRDAANLLAVDVAPGRATVTRTKSGTPTRLASVALPSSRSGAFELTIKRRLWRITLLCDGAIIGRAYDNQLSGGRAGWKASRGVNAEVRLQSTEPIDYTDDFARAPGEGDAWNVLAGKCRVAEVAVGNHKGEVGRYSSNAFSWAAQAQPLALSAAGYWFWDDYAVEASVKPETGGAVGLVAYLKDGSNFFLFRWSAAKPGQPDSGAREIIRVTNGTPKVLASAPGGFRPGQWYRLRFSVCDGMLAASIDGRTACTAQDEGLGQGKAGLYARDSAHVTFDDVRVVGARALRETLAEIEPGKWDDAAGEWQTNAKARRREAPGSEGGLTVTGRSDWSDYVFAADVAPGNAGQVGLCFAYRDPAHYCLFEVPAATGKATLVRVEGDKRTTLAEAPRPAASDRMRLKIDLLGGRARGYLNDQLVVEAYAAAPLAGRAGFYAKGGPGAAFGSVGGYFANEEPPRPRVEEQFAREATMMGWASARGSWVPDGQGMYWHTGNFYGTPGISFDMPEDRASFYAILALAADGSNAESGYQLLARLMPGNQARLELRRQGQTVATETGEWANGSGDRRLRFWRDGAFVAAALGDRLAVSYRDSQPLTGTRVGIMATRLGEIFTTLDATTPNVLDCTFSGPPTEWWSTRGVWDVAQRWPCDDRWSFFGGLRSESPMLWTKQSFSGDVTVEAWVALYMDNIDDPYVGYTHPSDLNLSFCTNGKDLSSGYSFLFAAANNTVTRLMRGDQVVAETGAVRMIDPRRLNVQWQRHWYHLRVEKRGNRIRGYVDGQLAADYTDPNPLPGGQVALWSWRNGLMVARARVWYEKGGELAPFPALPVTPAAVTSPERWSVSRSTPITLTADFERDTEGWATDGTEESPVLALDKGGDGSRCLRVVNPISGGDLQAWCGVQQFDAAKFPTLRFDYRLDPNARVNLYFRVKGRWMSAGFSAPKLAERGVPFLGAIPDVLTDGKWHTAEFGLRAALQRIVPGESQLLVEDLCFRSPDVEYLRSGFEGNTWGTGYALDNFRLMGASGTTAADARSVVMRAPARRE